MFWKTLAYTLLAGLATTVVHAQRSYPGCDPLKASDFRITEIFNRNGQNQPLASESGISEPTNMDLHAVRQGDSVALVDVYFVERLGKVKRYDAAAKKVQTLGTIQTLGQVDNGLMGIALHPDYDNNRWIYLWYSPKQMRGQNRLMRLSRFVVTPQWTLDMGSEKILIEILGSKSDMYHSGGPMTFDAHGDLWVTVGNNSPDLDPNTLNVLSTTDSTQSAEWGPSNTASLRGGIFRIHPDSSTKGYSIPKGNFGEHWAAVFEAQGKTALAAQYRDPAKVLPEVYVKGSRSNYSLWVHPTKGWLAWGEVNYDNKFDELNLVTKPVFAGYPYFHADNLPTGAHGKDVNAPKNTSPFNSGVTELPPAVPGMINNYPSHNVAITGPIYLFDPSLRSQTKFPPHLHHAWFSAAWSSSFLFMHTLDTVQMKVTKSERIDNTFLPVKLRRPLQAKFGPEGALYLLNYDGNYNTINPGVVRIEYSGACQVPVTALKPEPAPEPSFDLTAGAITVRDAGNHEVALL
ncbi:MAG TPA: PQQ-dependent sugar dehydrogenase, partial [Fibrobacteria bacterium]|nr:PQQ-dependent sugar dehydrogenase [Fibrobacteria bacterium]